MPEILSQGLSRPHSAKSILRAHRPDLNYLVIAEHSSSTGDFGCAAVPTGRKKSWLRRSKSRFRNPRFSNRWLAARNGIGSFTPSEFNLAIRHLLVPIPHMPIHNNASLGRRRSGYAAFFLLFALWAPLCFRTYESLRLKFGTEIGRFGRDMDGLASRLRIQNKKALFRGRCYALRGNQVRPLLPAPFGGNS
jgi:hypothetical protein